LGVDIAKGSDQIVLIHNIGRYLFADNLAEDRLAAHKVLLIWIYEWQFTFILMHFHFISSLEAIVLNLLAYTVAALKLWGILEKTY
jgi:hypothetical protein